VNADIGEVPDGVYNRNTKIFFCCRSDGPTDLPIVLPTSVPFYLLKFGGHCQKVSSAELCIFGLMCCFKVW